MNRIATVSQEILLTLGAVLGVICILATLSAVFFGVTPLIFRSGSMSPAISTGALALAQEVPGADIRVGDIVSAINPQGTRVTHRVEGVSARGSGSYALTMRGDANEVADPERYIVTSTDRVVWHLDGLGFVVQEAQKPPYIFALGSLVGALLVFSVRYRRAARQATDGAESPNDPTEPTDDGAPTDPPEFDGIGIFGTDDVATAPIPTARPAAGVVVKTSAAVLLALALVGGLFAGQPTDTQAAFTDETRATSATLASSLDSSFKPSAVTCTATGPGSRDLTITWSVPTTTLPPTSYAVSGGPTASPTQASNSGKVSVTFAAASLAVNSYTVTVTANHFTNWPASATPLTVNIAGNGGNRRPTCP
ncbi:signal peptidase I [Cryobacterium frigoriphilum]|uniref:Signal peptidase I n=1 Tax=Cryobacterium frigoriphilum TaxID=1259150 RepID=A0A4V3IS50_9MICO|nr:signal peptidase I [Cryobacterium frigoriphilum]TFD55166.1 signal peptidase I [Cryobacterium frigoriphilum]